jgi:hypothetical protein
MYSQAPRYRTAWQKVSSLRHNKHGQSLNIKQLSQTSMAKTPEVFQLTTATSLGSLPSTTRAQEGIPVWATFLSSHSSALETTSIRVNSRLKREQHTTGMTLLMLGRDILELRSRMGFVRT